MKSRIFTHITILLLVALATAAHAQISVLYEFGSKSGDPLNPQYSGIIAQGRDGNLYSTAPKGGANGYGAVFKITPKGAFSVLYSFDAIHGSSPTGGLTLGMDGNFYGTTTDGGTFGYGTIFKITPGGTLTTLYNFTGGADGKAPTAPPIQGTDGNFYGTASQGNGSTTYGSVYKLKPSSSSLSSTPLMGPMELILTLLWCKGLTVTSMVLRAPISTRVLTGLAVPFLRLRLGENSLGDCSSRGAVRRGTIRLVH